MSKHEKLLFKLLSGGADANFLFGDLCKLLDELGFEKRIKGARYNSLTLIRKAELFTGGYDPAYETGVTQLRTQG